MSICFVREWYIGFSANLLAPWLSQLTCTEEVDNPIFVKNLPTCTASFAASVSAIYSASTVERATVCCFLVFQDMAAHPKVNTYPEYDFLSTGQFPPSAPAYPFNFSFVFPNFK